MNRLGPIVLILFGCWLAFGNAKGCESFQLPIVAVDYPGSTVVLLESESPSASEAIIKSSSYWDGLESRQLKRVFSSNLIENQYSDIKDRPQLLILSAPDTAGQCKELYKSKLPETVAEIDSIVKKVTGR